GSQAADPPPRLRRVRAWLLPMLFAALAGCGESGVPAAPEPPAHAETALLRRYQVAPHTARGITRRLTIERGRPVFAARLVLCSRLLAPRSGEDLIAKHGDSYAAAVLGPANLTIELRRVIEQTVPAGQVGLCGASRPQYVALAYDERATEVTLLVFAGAEPPG